MTMDDADSDLCSTNVILELIKSIFHYHLISYTFIFIYNVYIARGAIIHKVFHA